MLQMNHSHYRQKYYQATHDPDSNLLASSAVHAQEAVQWKVSEGGIGHWYVLATAHRMPWTNARAWAVEIGGHLVTLSSQVEWGRLWAQFNGQDGYLIGLFQDPPTGLPPDLGWRWVTNKPLTFTAWGTGEPNDWNGYQQWVAQAGNAYWDDTISDGPQVPIVEWDADCNADGIVDYGQCHDGTLPDYNGNNIPDCCEQGVQCIVGNYPVQWRVEDGGNDRWYQLKRRSSVVSWASASEESVSLGGQLASILSEAEDVFVFSVADHPGAWQGYLGPWLGGWQVPGTGEPLGIWRWSSGEPWGYVGPDSTFPNNGGPPGTDQSRLHYIDFVRKWNDLPENGAPENGGGVRAFVIEWSADCNNDGVVDYGQILQGQLADANTDGIPDTCQCGTIPSLPACCPGDLDHDATVGGADIGLMLSNWGPCGGACLYDLNGDGKVNGGDLGLLLAGWGPCSSRS